MLEFDIENKIILYTCDAQDLDSVSQNRSFYKIIYILNGNGTAVLGRDRHDYQKGSIFLISPKRTLNFNPFRRTDILVIVFVDFRTTLMKPRLTINGLDNLFRYVEENLAPFNLEQGKRIKDVNDRKSVKELVKTISREMQQHGHFTKEIILNSICLLTFILVRNLTNPLEPAVTNSYDLETSQILEYVRRRVRDNKKVTIKDLAEGMMMSEYNLNRAIIKGTGSTLKSLIAQYRTGTFQNHLLNVGVDLYLS